MDYVILTTVLRTMSTSPFTAAHRLYVKSLYKRYLNNALDWTVSRDLWRPQALQIRAEFERHRYVHPGCDTERVIDYMTETYMTLVP